MIFFQLQLLLYFFFFSILSNDNFLSLSLCLSIALFLGIKMCKRPNVKVFFETRISISFSLATDSVPLSFHSSVDTLRSKIWDIFWVEKSFFIVFHFRGKHSSSTHLGKVIKLSNPWIEPLKHVVNGLDMLCPLFTGKKLFFWSANFFLSQFSWESFPG